MSDASRVDYTYWAKMAYWSLEEAVALSLGIDPFIAGSFSDAPIVLGANMGMDFARRMILVQRAVELGMLVMPLIPCNFAGWVRSLDLEIPGELSVAIASYGFAQKATEIQRKGIVSRIASVSDASFELCSRKSVNTLLKLVGGMAMAVYGFDPMGGRSTVVSEIQTDLDLKGINLDLDTIRKWLKEAGAIILAKDFRRSKPNSVMAK